MPVYLRRDTEQTPNSLHKPDSNEDDPTDFLGDPDMRNDLLPQPFRFIDKLIGVIVERAYSLYMNRVKAREIEASRGKPPLYKNDLNMKKFRLCKHMCTSHDGNLIVLCLRKGLAVMDAVTRMTLDKWKDPLLDLIFMDVANFGDIGLLILTVDRKAVGRLFVYYKGIIYLIHAFNDPLEEVTESSKEYPQPGITKGAKHVHIMAPPTATSKREQKPLVYKMQASEKGELIAVNYRNPSFYESWLEVYKLNREALLKDLEGYDAKYSKWRQAQEQLVTAALMANRETGVFATPLTTTTPLLTATALAAIKPSDGDRKSFKFTPPVLTLKVRPPHELQPSGVCHMYHALRLVDRSCRVVGLGSRGHNITKHHMLIRWRAYRYKNQKRLRGLLRKRLKRLQQGVVIRKKYKPPPAPPTSMTELGLQEKQMRIKGKRARKKAKEQEYRSMITMRRTTKKPWTIYRVPVCTFLYVNKRGTKVNRTREPAQAKGNKPASPVLMIPGAPSQVMVTWSYYHNICVYPLNKPAVNKDVELYPDRVIPSASPVTKTRLSSDHTLLAMAFRNNCVAIYDLQNGCLRTLQQPSCIGQVKKMAFLDPAIYPPNEEKAHVFRPEKDKPYPTKQNCYLLVTYSTGKVYTIQTAFGVKDPVKQLYDRQKVWARYSFLQMIPSVPELAVTCRRSGHMFIEDMVQGSTVCQLSLQAPYRLYSLKRPICALGGANSNLLYVRARIKPGSNRLLQMQWKAYAKRKHFQNVKPLKKLSKYQIFMFDLQRLWSLKEYWTRKRDQENRYNVRFSIKQRVKLLHQQRTETSEDRNKDLRQRWPALISDAELIEETVKARAQKLTARARFLEDEQESNRLKKQRILDLRSHSKKAYFHDSANTAGLFEQKPHKRSATPFITTAAENIKFTESYAL